MFSAVHGIHHLEMDGEDPQYSEDENGSEAFTQASHWRGIKWKCEAHLWEMATKRTQESKPCRLASPFRFPSLLLTYWFWSCDGDTALILYHQIKWYSHIIMMLISSLNVKKHFFMCEIKLIFKKMLTSSTSVHCPPIMWLLEWFLFTYPPRSPNPILPISPHFPNSFLSPKCPLFLLLLSISSPPFTISPVSSSSV